MPINKSLIITKDHLSPKISRALEIGQCDLNSKSNIAQILLKLSDTKIRKIHKKMIEMQQFKFIVVIWNLLFLSST